MIFDSFDWMQGEPELIGVDNYPIYASDPYYQQNLYLNDALQELSLPDFWKPCWAATINPDAFIGFSYVFDILVWHKLSQIRDKIIREKDFFVLQTIYSCCQRVFWLKVSPVKQIEDSLRNKYVNGFAGIAESLLSEIVHISDQEFISLFKVFAKDKTLHRNENIKKLIALSEQISIPSLELQIALKKFYRAMITNENSSTCNKWLIAAELSLQMFNINFGDVWSDRLLLDLEALESI